MVPGRYVEISTEVYRIIHDMKHKDKLPLEYYEQSIDILLPMLKELHTYLSIHSPQDDSLNNILELMSYALLGYARFNR